MKESKLPFAGLTLAFALPLLLLAGCASGQRPVMVFRSPPELPGTSTQPATTSRAPSVTIAFGPAKDGVSEVRLKATALRSAVIYGEAKAEGDGYRIGLTRLEWFSNWANGWTQVAFLLDGVAELRPTSRPAGEGGGWHLSVVSEPQLDTIESATIRYYGTYVRDDAGRTEFAHRWDRIRAVAADLTARAAGSAPANFADDPRALRRFLFPEIYGYDAKPARGHASALAQGVRWNLEYSKERFAEPLRILRDSGTLLRDYKESPGLWLLALGWKTFWETEGSYQR